MAGVVRPPYGAPTGPLLDDASVAGSFLAGSRTGQSPALHIEEGVLLSERFVPVAIRIGPDAVLVRADASCPGLAEAATARGLTLVEREPLLATVVALQAVGHAAASWDLWAADHDAAPRLLLAAASAENDPPPA